MAIRGGKFAFGNKLGGKRKEKMFYDALMLELKAEENPHTLRRIAKNLLRMAADDNDLNAIKEVANRIDGMPTQQIDTTNENITYVAELPSVAESAEEWLKNNPEMTSTDQKLQ